MEECSLWLTMTRNILTGGLEHLWAKIKNWLVGYFNNWKHTNFGDGSYSTGPSSFLDIHSGAKFQVDCKYPTNSDTSFGYYDIEFGAVGPDKSSGMFGINKDFTITEDRGFKVLFFQPSVSYAVVNGTGSTKNITILFVKYDTSEDTTQTSRNDKSLTVKGLKVTGKGVQLEDGDACSLYGGMLNYFSLASIIFWY